MFRMLVWVTGPFIAYFVFTLMLEAAAALG